MREQVVYTGGQSRPRASSVSSSAMTFFYDYDNDDDDELLCLFNTMQ